MKILQSLKRKSQNWIGVTMTMSNKEKYRKLCTTEGSIPIFSRDWWLDAVAGEDWDVSLVEKNNEIIASFPYVLKKQSSFKRISMPKLTQTMGIWIKYPPEQKYVNKLSYEKEHFSTLIDQLPSFDSFKQNFHYSITNWLPFYWKEFEGTTSYTYVIEDLTDTESIFKGFKENIRREIRKAQKKVKVYTSDDIEKFYEINKLTFERQGIPVPYSLDYLRRLDEACVNNNSRKIFFAEDEEGHIHSANYIVWDENSAYYIMGGGDPKLRRSGATSLVMWEAIQFAATVTKRFDFEGSMIEPIERFFRSFGATQKPFFQVTKTNSRVLKLRKLIRTALTK
jgi:hypothetical protein